MKTPWTRRPISWAPVDVPLNPFEQGKVEWNKWLKGAWKSARKAWIVAYCSLALNGYQAYVNWQLAERVKVVPYVVEIVEGRRVRGVGLVGTAREIPPEAQQQLFEAMLGRWIEDFRGVTVDWEFEKKKWWNVYAFLTNNSAQKMNQYVVDTQPMRHVGKMTVLITDIVVLKETERTYRMTWKEQVKDVVTDAEQTTAYQGLFHVLMGDPPSKEEAMQRNPLGLYIGDWGIKKVSS